MNHAARWPCTSIRWEGPRRSSLYLVWGMTEVTGLLVTCVIVGLPSRYDRISADGLGMGIWARAYRVRDRGDYQVWRSSIRRNTDIWPLPS